ncbi:MAG: dipeptide/oligopeptide/nickel ABC transporter ATP-binding protein [Methanomassiliicoccus sp.]|nr:dipeptide/oligopeptide/nickel ABC transporter ATP-binding protein [Methanomassiliicoccus sp.]
MSTMMEVTDLSKYYGKVKIFENINFTISAHETLGLYGDSGGGKTTVGRMLVKLDRPTSGQILYKGHDINEMGRREFRRYRSKLQMIFQNPETSIDPRSKLYDCVAEPLIIQKKGDKEEIRKEVSRLVEMVGLRDIHLQRYPHQLSGGEIQRAVLARVIALRPELIVADEATSMLDVSTQAQVLRLMQKIQEETGVSYLMISHDEDVLKATCDRILKFQNGSLKEV